MEALELVNLKKDILEYIRQPIPIGLDIVDLSVPIVFFGNLEKANISTISINPSDKEFLDKNKIYLKHH